MKERKNIDRLFQEKFKDFEVNPSDHVWATIAASRKEKKERRVIPIWWKLGGIAASLLLLVALGNSLLDSTTNEGPQIVNQDTEGDVTPPEGSGTAAIDLGTNNDTNVSQDNSSINGSEGASGNIQSANSIANENANGVSNGAGTTSRVYATGNDIATYIAQNSNSQNKNKSTSAQQEKNATQIAQKSNSKIIPKLEKNDGIAGNADSKSIIGNPIITDNTAIAQEESVTLEKDLVAEAKKITEEKADDIAQIRDPESNKRWGVGAVAAPVYYGDFGGSGLDASLKDNKKTGDVNLSYGVQLSYAVSPKFKVRTGVTNVNLSYSTEGVGFSTTGNSRSIQGIRFDADASALNIFDTRDGSPIVSEFGPSFQPVGVSSIGSLQQQISYIEVPFEAVYSLVDKRVGVSLVGGVSTLFLNNNEVVLRSDALTTSLGTASGLNDISFTTNVGLGLDYKVTNKLKFNLEPSLKYQLNSYDETIGDFKAYYLGVYTGFSYKF